MVFLGREISETRNYSEKVAEEIDGEVFKLIDTSYVTAKDILTANKGKLDQIVKALLVEETLEGESLAELLKAPVGEEAPLKRGEAKPPEADKPAGETGGKKAPTPKPTIQPQPGLAFEGGQTQSHLETDPT